MNKKIFLPVLVMAMMLAGCMLSSCSSNNDELVTPKAKTATVKSTLYIMDPMLDYCDMTVTVGSNTTTLTASNTTATTYKGYDVRKYEIMEQSYTSFPQTVTVEAKCQAKDGFDLKSLGKANYCFCIVTDVDNDNNGKFDRLVCEDNFKPNKGYKFGDVDEATAKARVNRTVSTNITLNSANDVEVAYVETKL